MSDYLSSLVMRGLNQTEVIKPRLASFFEPSVQGEPVFGDESGSERLDASSTSDETVHDNHQSVWRSDPTPQLKPAALQPAGSESQQTPGQPRLGMTRQASSSLSLPSSPSISSEVTSQSSGKTPQQKSSQDLPAPSGGDETYVASPRDAAERNRASVHEPAIQPPRKTHPRASEPSTEAGDIHPARMMDQTPQLKPVTIQPAGPGSQQTPGQPRSGIIQQASPSASSISPEVTSQPSGKTPQQKSSQDLQAPSGGDENYVVSPGATAERNRASAYEPAINPITIESSSPTSPEVTAQPSAVRVVQRGSDHEMLTPPLSGGDETYMAPTGATVERNRSSVHEPAINPITIESSSPPTSPEVTAPQSAGRMVQQGSDHEILTPPSPGDGETYQPLRVTAERNRESTCEPAIQPITIERIVPSAKTQPRASEPAEPAVIRVTIGRIEVRATTPPLPAAPRTLPPGPALTLDDYLKQRNGGQL